MHTKQHFNEADADQIANTIRQHGKQCDEDTYEVTPQVQKRIVVRLNRAHSAQVRKIRGRPLSLHTRNQRWKNVADRVRRRYRPSCTIWILGIKMERDKANGITTLSQTQYIKDLEVDRSDDVKLDLNGKFLYQNIVGALIYVSVCTRPDIANAVRQVAMRSAEPTARHLTATPRPTTKPTTSLLDLLTRVGPKIGRPADQQQDTSVTLSSCEAEYTALSQAAQEALHLICDNQGAKFIASNPTTSARSKHIDIKVHFVREVVRVTKALASIKFKNLAMQVMGIKSNEFLLVPDSPIEGGVSVPLVPMLQQ